MTAITVATAQEIEPIKLITAIPSEQNVPKSESVVAQDEEYIDFPPDKLASDLIKSQTISSEGTFLKGNDLQIGITDDICKTIHDVMNKPLSLNNPFENEPIEYPVKDVMKVVKGENYLVGSEVLLTLGRNWILLFFKQYVKDVDMQLLKQFEEESSDFDFRIKIPSNRSCRQEAEKVVDEIAKKSKYKIRYSFALVTKEQTFTAFHPFFKIVNGEIVEDSFLVSTKQIENSKIQTFDFIISRIYAGDMLSTQDIRIDIGGPKPVLCGNYQQAIIDRVLKQYRYLRITAKSWARSMVMHCEFYTHKNEVPNILFYAVRSFCDDARTVEDGLCVLIESYIHKHFRNNPDAIVALAFNMSISLYKRGFDYKELIDFWKKIALKVDKRKLHPHYEAVLKWACHIPFQELLSFIQMAKFIELGHQTIEGRSVNKDCDYIVIHLDQPHIASKRSGFTTLIPYQPVQALQFILKNIKSRNSEKIRSLFKDFADLHTFRTIENNILVVNFSRDTENNLLLQKRALGLFEHKESSIQLFGFQLSFQVLQLNPSLDNFEKVLQYYPFVIEVLDNTARSSVHQVFLNISKNEKLYQSLKNLSANGVSKIRCMEVYAVHYPHVVLDVIKADKNALSEHPEIIDCLLHNISEYQKELPKEFFPTLVQVVKSVKDAEKRPRAISQCIFRAIQELVNKNKLKTAFLLLQSSTKEKLLNGHDVALIWFTFIDKIASFSINELPKLILQANQHKVWMSNVNILHVSTGLLDCLSNMLETQVRKNADAAIKLTKYLHSNNTLVQKGRLENLNRRANEVSELFDKDLVEIEKDFGVLKERFKSENLSEELVNEFEEMFKRALEHDPSFIRTMILDHHIRPLYFNFPIRFLKLLNGLIEFFSKRNEEVASLLVLPFSQIIVDGKCPCDEVVIKFIQHFIEYVLRVEIANSNITNLLEVNVGQFLNVLMKFERSDLSIDVFKALKKHNILYEISPSLCLDCVALVLSKSSAADSVWIFSVISCPKDNENRKRFLSMQIEFVDMLISKEHFDDLEAIISKFIHYISGDELNELELSRTILSWSRHLIKIESYELATNLLNALENSYVHLKDHLIKMLEYVPDNILKLSPVVFCRAVNAIDPVELQNLPAQKVNSVVLYLLKSQNTGIAVELALDVLEKRKPDIDEVLLKAMDSSLKLKTIVLGTRAFNLRKMSLTNFEAIPRWTSDPTLTQRWLRAWECAMKIVSLYLNIEKTFIEDQVNDALNENSYFHKVLNGLPDQSLRKQTLRTLIESSIESISLHNPEKLKKRENLLFQLKSECSEPKDWEELEKGLMEHYFHCKNLNQYVKACDFTIDLIEKQKENFGNSELVLASISGANSLHQNGLSVPFEFSMLLRYVRYVSGLTPKQLEPIREALKVNAMAELFIFNEAKTERYHGKKIGEYRRYGFRIKEPVTSSRNQFLEDVDRFIWNFQIFKKGIKNVVRHPLQSAANLKQLSLRRTTVLLHNTFISEVNHPVRAFFYVPILIFTIAFNNDIAGFTFETNKRCGNTPLKSQDHVFIFSVYLINLYLTFLVLNSFVGFYKRGKGVLSEIFPKKEKKHLRG